VSAGDKPRDFVAGQWSWTDAPSEWEATGPDSLTWKCLPESDFWRLTASGVIRHNGQAFVTQVDGDFTMEGRLDADLGVQYDQTGFIVLASEDRWVKAGAEWENELLIGAVHTGGYSDWSMSPGSLPVGLRIRRQGDTLEVAVRVDDGGWTMIRQLNFPGVVSVGPYSCAPVGEGFETRLSDFALRAG
jgi:regulation of enolase protein 1 (concanavalin A-like superfamily)